MLRLYMKYSAVLIGAYLLLEHYTAAGTLISDGASGITKIDQTLQGR